MKTKTQRYQPKTWVCGNDREWIGSDNGLVCNGPVGHEKRVPRTLMEIVSVLAVDMFMIRLGVKL